MARNQISLFIGIVLLAVGLAAAFYGVYNYINLQNSVANKVGKFLAGTTEGEKQAVIYIAAGGVAVILGIIFLSGKKKRRRRR